MRLRGLESLLHSLATSCIFIWFDTAVCLAWQHPRERVKARDKVNLFLPTAEELLADDRKDLLQKVRVILSIHTYTLCMRGSSAVPFCEASGCTSFYMHFSIACRNADSVDYALLGMADLAVRRVRERGTAAAARVQELGPQTVTVSGA
jgi:hypothetical protein